MSTRSHRGFTNRRGNKDERGSVLVELTMIVPLLLTLVLGMMEMGMAWRDQQTITQASRQGARVGSSIGTEPNADQQAVAAAMAVLDDEQRANINFIMVYQPINGNGDPSVNCLNLAEAAVANGTDAGGSTGCNFWAASLLRDPAFDATIITSTGWAPAGRKDTLANTGAGNGPDRYGVLVEVDRPWFTGYFPGDGMEVRAKTVMQLEPDIS